MLRAAVVGAVYIRDRGVTQLFAAPPHRNAKRDGIGLPKTNEIRSTGIRTGASRGIVKLESARRRPVKCDRVQCHCNLLRVDRIYPALWNR
jgi:hypothetical protein